MIEMSMVNPQSGRGFLNFARAILEVYKTTTTPLQEILNLPLITVKSCSIADAMSEGSPS
jgi:hypothetical protein